MNIAFLTHEPIYPPSGGGSAEAVYLLREMVVRGHVVTVFCPAIEDQSAVEKKLGIQIVPFQSWKMGRFARLRNFKYLFYPRALEHLVLKHSPQSFDLLFAQHSIAAVTAGRLRAKLGIPVVMNFLDFLTAFTETWPRYIAPRSIVRAITGFEIGLPSKYQADAILTVSDPLADRFADAGFPMKRTKAIYYGFDSDLFRPPARWNVDDSKPVIVMHGSFDKHHLGPIIRDAIDFIATKRPGLTFRFVGPQTPALESLMEHIKGLAPAFEVQSTGFVPYEDIPRHLADARMGIVPYEESRGTHCAFVAKAVEYLAMGIPVVSTPLQSLKSYFPSERLLRYSTFNGVSFGGAILEMLNATDPITTDERTVISRKIHTDLSWKRIAAQAIDFTESIICADG